MKFILTIIIGQFLLLNIYAQAENSNAQYRIIEKQEEFEVYLFGTNQALARKNFEIEFDINNSCDSIRYHLNEMLLDFQEHRGVPSINYQASFEDCKLERLYYLIKMIRDEKINQADSLLLDIEGYKQSINKKTDSLSFFYFNYHYFKSRYFSQVGEYPESRHHALQALRIAEKYDEPTLIAKAINAKHYGSRINSQIEEQVRDLSSILNNGMKPITKVVSLANLSIAQGKLKNVDSSLFYIQNAIELNEKYGLKKKGLYGTLANVYLIRNEYSKALRAYNKDYLEIDTINRFDIAINRLNVGMVHYNSKAYHEAIGFFEQAFEFAESSRNFDFLQFVKSRLAQCYYHLGDFKRAYVQMSHVHPLKDSVHDVKTQRMLREHEIKYNSEKKDLENQLLLSEVETQSSTIKSQRYLVGLLLSGSMLGLFGIYHYRKRKMALKQSNELKEQLLLTKEHEALLLNEENLRLQASNTGLKDKIDDLNNDPQTMLKHTWIINPRVRLYIPAELGNILFVATSIQVRNKIEYVLKDADENPLERRTLSNLEDDPNWSKHIFMRIHQSFIINLYNIRSIDETRKEVYVKHFPQPLKVSPDKIQELKNRYTQIFGDQ